MNDNLFQLGERIVELAARINIATYEMLTLIAEFDRCEGWAEGRLHLVRRMARRDDRADVRHRAGECARGSRACGLAAHFCRDELRQTLLRQGTGHDPGRDPEDGEDAAQVRARRVRRRADARDRSRE